MDLNTDIESKTEDLDENHYSSPKEERKKMESTNKGENGHALFSNFQSTPNKTEPDIQVQLSSPQWSRIHGVAAVAPALEQHRAKVGNVRNKITKKVTVCQAVRQGMIVELEDLIKECQERVNMRDKYGLRPIHYATRYNHAATVELLLTYKADKNSESIYGITPLHIAGKTNAVDAAEILIKHGANVSVRDCKQKTPLHLAARRGNIEVMKVLLNSGHCDVNSKDEDKLTPLHEAAAHKHEKAVKLLVQYDADIFAEEINEALAFHFAASEDMTDILAYFLKVAYQHGGKPLEDKLLQHADNEGNTALHLAVVNSRLQVAEFLLEKGADVNNSNNHHHTPLHFSAGNGDTNMVQLLLGHGALVDVTDNDFMTPCHRAALQNKYKVISILMEQGANINSKTKDQYTPLLLASSKGHTDTVQFLVKNGAQMAEADFSNKTVLHVAVESGYYPVILALLKEKSCFNLMEALDFNDQAAVHYAAKNGNTLILSTLIKHGAKLDIRDTDGKTPLHIAAENDNDNAIETLYHASQTELNDGDDDGQTPLMLACESGNYKSAKTLLSLGADIVIRDENFCTALLLAAREGYANIVKVLMDNYGEVNQSDKIKNTPLHVACSNGHIDVIKVLLKYKADVTLANSYGKTALDQALDHKQSEAAVALLKHTSWRDSMNVRDSKGFTPMTRLIQRCPEAALVVLDNCVEYSSQKRDDVNFTVKFDYTYIDPGVDDEMSKKSRYFAPKIMTKYKREELLSHILVQSNLTNKWVNRGYIHFYLNFIIYTIYLLVLQLYAFVMPKIRTNVLDNVRSCPLLLNATMLADPAVVNTYKERGEYSNMMYSSPSLEALEFILFVLILIVGINQILMFLATGFTYFADLDNILTWVMVVSTILFLVPFGYYACVEEWRAGWIACTLGWILFMGNLRGFNFIGIYFIMFSEVLKSLLKVIFILVIYLMAFSTAFVITLGNTSGFKFDDVYPMTTFAMMLGEYNYIDNFNNGANDPFSIDGYFIMLCFFLIMPLALMNFLTGIAVGDIAKVESTAYISGMSIFIDKTYLTEIRFPRKYQRRWKKTIHTVFPNKKPSTVWQKVKEVLFGSEESRIRMYIDTGKTNDDDEKEQLKLMLKKQSSQITKLHNLLKQQQEMMRQMADHLHVDIKLDSLSLAESLRSEMASRIGL